MDQTRCLRCRECKGEGRGHGFPCCVLIAAAAPPKPRNLFRRALYQLLDSADLKIYMHTTLQTCLVVVLGMVSYARDFNSFDFPLRLWCIAGKPCSLVGTQKCWEEDSAPTRHIPSNLTQKVAGASHDYWCNSALCGTARVRSGSCGVVAAVAWCQLLIL